MSRLRRLPLAIEPVPEELLESYLARVAWVHGIPYSLLLEHLSFPRGTVRRPMTSQLGSNDLERLSDATGLDAHQVGSLVTPPTSPDVPSDAWPDRPPSHQWRSHPQRYFGEQRMWSCPTCLEETSGAILRPWLTGHTFVCLEHRNMLVSRCPSCNGFLVLPQRSCPTDPERRCVDIVATAEVRHATDPETRAAQTVYSSIATRGIVHTACALEPFLLTLLDGAAAHPVQARLQRRAVALGHRGDPPTAGPTYMALITPELITLARFIQTPTAVAPWQLVTEMAEALGADPERLSSGRPEFLQETAVDILEYWWGPYGRNAWRAKISHNR
jgi:TniQ